MSRYNMGSDDKDDIHNRAVKNLDKIRQLDENNPMERAIKFDKAKRNPPTPGYINR